MEISNPQLTGNWIDMRTGQRYSGAKRSPFDLPADPKTGTPIFPMSQIIQPETTQPPIKVGVADVLREIPTTVKKMVTSIPETFTPATTEFFKTTGETIGEGLAYLTSKTVREEYQKGNLDILPTVSKTAFSDIVKKTLGSGIEATVYSMIPSTLARGIYARFGIGALQGLGMAVSEGLAKDHSVSQIIDNAKRYATFSAAMEIVLPYLPRILNARIQDIPSVVGKSLEEIGQELSKPVKAIERDLIGRGFSPRDAKELSTQGGYLKLPEEPLPKKSMTDIRRKTPKDPVQKIIAALEEAKPLREIQETLYTKERGKRLAKSLAIGEEITGEAGFYAEKGAFRGELPRVEFESIRNKVGQADIDSLFIKIKESQLLGEWEKIPAREGLAKLFGEYGGSVPTKGEIELLNKVFPEEFTETLLAKRPLMERIKEAGGQLANVPRSIMSSFDLSFGGRQGLFAAPSFREEFFDSWTKQFKIFGSEKAYIEAMENVNKNPLFDLAKDSGVSFTNLGVVMSQREERFMSQWAEKIPVVGKLVKASSRAYTAFANKFRMDIFSSLVDDAVELGLEPMVNRDLSKQIANFVNEATGRGALPKGLEKAATTLNAFFFSPRLMASRLRLLVPAEYVMAEPFVRKQYLKSLLTFAGTVTTVLGLSKLAGAEVETNTNSSDWGKIKIGNTRIDIMGGFQQYIRMGSQLISGKYISSTTGKEFTLGEGYKPVTRLDILMRQVESKEAPIFSFVTDLLRGQDYAGKPIDLKSEIASRFVPIAIGDIVDIARDDPSILPLSALGIFGVGLQTYSPTFTPFKVKNYSNPSTGTFKIKNYTR